MPGSNDVKNTGNGHNLKAFVRSRTGAVRERLSGGRISALEQRLERTRKRLKKSHRRLENKDQEIAALRERLELASRATDAPVFFVVGQAKSGTGWLMKMLNAHPEVLCGGEGKFFGQGWDDEKEWMSREPDSWYQGGALYGAMTHSGPIKYWMERPSFWSRKGGPEDRLNSMAGAAVKHFLRARLVKTDKRMVGDKTPLPGPDTVREISAAIPEARIIHIIRDGRDQAVSWMHHKWKGAQDMGGRTQLTPEELAKRDDFFRTRSVPLEVDGGGIFTEDRLRTVASYWRDRVGTTVTDGSALFGDRYVEVRYENLLERPVEEIRRLFGFLGADDAEEVARRCVEAYDFETLSGRKRGNEEYEMGFQKRRKGIAGDWKNVFTERDKVIYKEIAGGLLIELGYADDNDW